MAELRKMTIGEVSEIAEDPKETIRSRINRGVAEAKKSPGWARFDVPSATQIAVHAELMRRTDGNHEIALQTANFIAEGLANFLNYPPRSVARSGQLAGHYLIFRRHDSGHWTYFWAQDRSSAAETLGRYLAESDEREAGGFYTVNVGTFTDWALDRIFDLQGIDDGEANV